MTIPSPKNITGAFPTYSGSGSPVGVQTGVAGETYIDTSTSPQPLWYKQTGSDNTGWSEIGQVGVGSGTISSLTGDVTASGTGAVAATLVGTSNVNSVVAALASVSAKAPLAAPHLTGAAQMAGDFTFDANTHGPVIVDQSNGHTYRIISTAGVLSTVQVS